MNAGWLEVLQGGQPEAVGEGVAALQNARAGASHVPYDAFTKWSACDGHDSLLPP